MSIEKELQDYKAEFNKIYHSTILPFFREYEERRKKRYIRMIIISSAAIIIFLLGCCSYFTNTDSFWGEVWISLTIPALITFAVAQSWVRYCFVSEIKEECMRKILSALGNISWGGLNKPISVTDMKNSELFNYDTENLGFDDIFQGSYKDVSFKISETESFGNREVIILFQSNKSTKNKTIISKRNDRTLKKHAMPYLLQFLLASPLILLIIGCIYVAFSQKQWLLLIYSGILGTIVYVLVFECIEIKKKESKQNYEKNMHEIKLEDSDFSRKYIVYSSDEVEARYLVTTAFIERFKNMQTAFESKKIKCSFYNDKLMFVIPVKKNVFEIGNISKPLTDPKTLEKFFNEIISIYLIINHFKLNENTKL